VFPSDIFKDVGIQILIHSVGRAIGVPSRFEPDIYNQLKKEENEFIEEKKNELHIIIYKFFPEYFQSLIVKALSTNWISYEIDKIVSIFYFSVVLVLIIISVDYEHSSSLLTILNSNSLQTSSHSATIPSNLILIATVLLLIAIIGIGYMIYVSVLRLYKRNRIIVTYFFAQEKIIPTLKDIAASKARFSFRAQDLTDVVKEFKVEALENANTELLASINGKDWGMAEFYASTLEGLVTQLTRSLAPLLPSAEKSLL